MNTTNVVFTCSNDEVNFPDLIFFKINGTTVTNKNAETYASRGITWASFYNNNNKKTGFEVEIETSLENNNTEIQCFLHPCVSNKVSLIIVDGMFTQSILIKYKSYFTAYSHSIELPYFTTPPKIDVLNSTIMYVEWDPVWTHPVNQYTLIVYENATDTTTIYTTTDTSYIVSRYIVSVDCSELEFSILAETDLGTTDKSAAAIKGFPKGT